MGYPPVIFEDTVEARQQYLTYLAKQIRCGYYQARRFLILPRLVEKEPRAVYFPNLKYPRRLWEGLSGYTAEDFDYFFPEKITSLIKIGPGPGGKNLERGWKKREKNFFASLTKFLPKLDLKNILFIKVLPVEFGTVGSFYFERKNNGYEFYHTIRLDFGPAQLAETILTQILWTCRPVSKLTEWYQKEAVTDFLMTSSVLGKIFDYDYRPTVTGLPDLPENLAAEARDYLAKLGFPLTPIISLEKESLVIAGQTVANTFTPTERRVLCHLAANKGKLVTYDEIGDLFWGDSEEALDRFNLASIAKLMEKIRKKIKDHEVYQELIFTIRGQGYMMYD
jgi:hypothetical protein